MHEANPKNPGELKFLAKTMHCGTAWAAFDSLKEHNLQAYQELQRARGGTLTG